MSELRLLVYLPGTLLFTWIVFVLDAAYVQEET